MPDEPTTRNTCFWCGDDSVGIFRSKVEASPVPLCSKCSLLDDAQPTTRAERIAQHPGGVVVRTIDPPHPVTPAPMTEERFGAIENRLGDLIEMTREGYLPRTSGIACLLEFVIEARRARAAEDRLTAENERLRAALERIGRWVGEFPEVQSRDGKLISYGVAYGSGGERDYMRSVAMRALHPEATE